MTNIPISRFGLHPSIVVVTGRAHCQRQVAFLSITSVCHISKLVALRA